MARLQATRQTIGRPAQDFRITSVLKGDLVRAPGGDDAMFADRFLLIGTQLGTGAAFCPHEDDWSSEQLLGQDARSVEIDHVCQEIALLDAVLFEFRRPSITVALAGTSSERSRVRGELIAGELLRLVNSGGRVLVVGSTSTMIATLQGAGFEVWATDLDPAVVATSVHGVRIASGTETAGLLGMVDAAVVTGMTMTTGTVDGILDIVRDRRVPTLFFCQTGASLAHLLLDCGASAVIGEQFPFYMFPGVTNVEIFRAARPFHR